MENHTNASAEQYRAQARLSVVTEYRLCYLSGKTGKWHALNVQASPAHSTREAAEADLATVRENARLYTADVQQALRVNAVQVRTRTTVTTTTDWDAID